MTERFEVSTDATVAEFLHDAYRSVSREIDARLDINPRPLFAPADARMEHNLAVRDRLMQLAIAAHEGRLVIMDRDEQNTETDTQPIPEQDQPKPKPPTTAGGTKRTPDGGEWVTER